MSMSRAVLLLYAFAVLPTLLCLHQVNAAEATEPRVSRAAVSDQIKKWEDGIIYYSFDSSVNVRLQNILREAMDEWEDNTCVIFKAQKDEALNFVEFYSRPNEEYCTCDSIGDRGGKQLIKLGYSCQKKGEILHLLGHILGFSHEQARPDRDIFVQINFDNIEPGQEGNFVKLPDNSSLGIVDENISYDYNSIMHLKPTAFSKNGSAITTEVMNEIEYDHQGKPKLGQRLKISEKDVQHTNSLYGCPTDGESVRGILQINILNGEALPEIINPTVQLTLMKSNGDNKIVSARYGSQNIVRNPTWNVHFRISIDGSTSFPWQNIRLKIFGGEDDKPVPISMSETIRVVPDQQRLLKHCIDMECSGYLMYNYEFHSDGNDCDPNPCMYGNCTDGLLDYACSCPPGFDGKNCSNGGPCEVSPRPCDATGTQQCVNNGPFDYICQCNVGYTGKECSIDVCSAHLCENNGTCIHSDNSRGYECSCRVGYNGDLCQTHVCSSRPCQNEGTCSHHNIHGYQCSCRPGFYGENCQNHVCSSSPQPCQNGGICSPHDTHAYQCTCRPGYRGENCTVNVCSQNPCQNGGTCVHYGNSQGYQCHCPIGYQDQNCSSHVCSTQPCQNGGTCSHHNTRAYQCSCRPGYQGENCNIDVCSSNPCRNRGTCRHNANSRGYVCNCRPGYQGTTCSLDVCSNRPCQNGGSCEHHSNSRGYRCYCPTGYQGDRCEINVCSRNPCRNGGTCAHHANSRGYICNCRPGYQGTTCSTNVCSRRPCQNGGSCVHYSNSRGYVCECGSQYSGTYCQTDLCPCQNGYCSRYSSSTSYTCSCRSGYGGERCQYRRGNLRIYANRGYNLPDTDGWLAGDSDPYFRAVAYNQDGNSYSRSTGHDQGDESPEWYTWLRYGVDEWKEFKVRLYDNDPGSDDTLSSWETYVVRPGCHNNLRICGHHGCGGYVNFDYCFD